MAAPPKSTPLHQLPGLPEASSGADPTSLEDVLAEIGGGGNATPSAMAVQLGPQGQPPRVGPQPPPALQRNVAQPDPLYAPPQMPMPPPNVYPPMSAAPMYYNPRPEGPAYTMDAAASAKGADTPFDSLLSQLQRTAKQDGVLFAVIVCVVILVQTSAVDALIVPLVQRLPWAWADVLVKAVLAAFAVLMVKTFAV